MDCPFCFFHFCNGRCTPKVPVWQQEFAGAKEAKFPAPPTQSPMPPPTGPALNLPLTEPKNEAGDSTK